MLCVVCQSPLSDIQSSYVEEYKQEGIILKTFHVGKYTHFTLGRNAEWANYVLTHNSISRQHSAFLHTTLPANIPPFSSDSPVSALVLVDLHSSHHTFLNGTKLAPGCPYVLFDNDIISLGGSTRKLKVKGLGKLRPKGQLPIHVASETLKPEPETSKQGEKRSREETSNSENRDSKKSQPDKVRCRHLLVKHAGSRRASSWRNEVITITKEEAKEKVIVERSEFVFELLSFVFPSSHILYVRVSVVVSVLSIANH